MTAQEAAAAVPPRGTGLLMPSFEQSWVSTVTISWKGRKTNQKLLRKKKRTWAEDPRAIAVVWDDRFFARKQTKLKQAGRRPWLNGAAAPRHSQVRTRGCRGNESNTAQHKRKLPLFFSPILHRKEKRIRVANKKKASRPGAAARRSPPSTAASPTPTDGRAPCSVPVAESAAM
jgi:hypothetical protein